MLMMDKKIFQVLFYIFLILDMILVIYLFFPNYEEPEPDSKYCLNAKCDCTTRGNNGKCKCSYFENEGDTKEKYVYCTVKEDIK
jgi:hypothetical protein